MNFQTVGSSGYDSNKLCTQQRGSGSSLFLLEGVTLEACRDVEAKVGDKEDLEARVGDIGDFVAKDTSTLHMLDSWRDASHLFEK